MLKPSDLTKAELLQVLEILNTTAEYYLERALCQIERMRNDAHHEKSMKLIDDEKRHYDAYFDLLRPYDGKPIKDIPQDVMNRALSELDKAQAAGKEWARLNGIRLKGGKCDGEC